MSSAKRSRDEDTEEDENKTEVFNPVLVSLERVKELLLESRSETKEIILNHDILCHQHRKGMTERIQYLENSALKLAQGSKVHQLEETVKQLQKQVAALQKDQQTSAKRLKTVETWQNDARWELDSLKERLDESDDDEVEELEPEPSAASEVTDRLLERLISLETRCKELEADPPYKAPRRRSTRVKKPTHPLVPLRPPRLNGSPRN